MAGLSLSAALTAGCSCGAAYATTPSGEASRLHAIYPLGEDPNESVAAYGPFIMNTQEELAEVFERYRAGKMGRLDAVHVST
jgi:pirin-like protein